MLCATFTLTINKEHLTELLLLQCDLWLETLQESLFLVNKTEVKMDLLSMIC